MARVLVTGMSGAGKTSLLDELSRRGHETVDTDYGGWTLPDGDWDEPRMAALLARRTRVVVSGTVANQVRFYDRFDHVILLSAPLAVLLDRVMARSSNPYGKSPGQRAEIERHVRDVEPLLRRGASLELDGRLAVADLADVVERLIDGAPAAAERHDPRPGKCCPGRGPSVTGPAPVCESRPLLSNASETPVDPRLGDSSLKPRRRPSSHSLRRAEAAMLMIRARVEAHCAKVLRPPPGRGAGNGSRVGEQPSPRGVSAPPTRACG